MLNEAGDVTKRQGVGRCRSKRTKKAVAAVKAKIKRYPRRSIRQLAKEHNTGKSTMAQMVKEDGNGVKGSCH